MSLQLIGFLLVAVPLLGLMVAAALSAWRESPAFAIATLMAIVGLVLSVVVPVCGGLWAHSP